MASLSRDMSKDGYRLSFRQGEKDNKRKRSIWLGKLSEAKATEFKTHLEHLLVVDEMGEPPSKATAVWIARLSDDLHGKLATVGLVEARETRVLQNITLGKWCDTYIAERKDVKPSTAETYKKAKDCLVAYFGVSKPIRSIKKDDALRWSIWLATEGNRRDKKRTTMADATVRRRTGKAKQFFAQAVERKLISENPFNGLATNVKANRKRQFFVPSDRIELCIDAAPDTTWKTIIALARYGGLRCPSELVRLKWTDINLPANCMTIHAPKTEHHDGGDRQCPIFPELKPYLEKAWDDADDGAVYVVERYRGGAVNLRTRFEAIIKAAGLLPWPKLFQNLRATRETELMAKFPAKDVATWLGNSVPVAMESYAMPMKESFIEATKTRTSSVSGSTGGSIPADAASSDAPAEPAENSDLDQESEAVLNGGGAVMDGSMGDTGLESLRGSTADSLNSEKVVPCVVPSGSRNVDFDQAELLGIWDRLDTSSRKALLAIARGLDKPLVNRLLPTSQV